LELAKQEPSKLYKKTREKVSNEMPKIGAASQSLTLNCQILAPLLAPRGTARAADGHDLEPARNSALSCASLGFGSISGSDSGSRLEGSKASIFSLPSRCWRLAADQFPSRV
jgi:hypothetical protein